MAKYTISQFTMPDGNVLELKDKVAREAVSGGTHFMGVTSTALTDGSNSQTITISGDDKLAINGDIAVYGNKEFIWADADGAWHELGDVSMLGALAVKDEATGTYTPEGNVSATFSGSAVSYTPEGTITAPEITVDISTVSINELDAAGSVTAGTAASATMPTLTFTPEPATENLTISWTDGSFTANVPTAVTLPTSTLTEVATGVTVSYADSFVFSGTSASITAEGTIEASFSGTSATITVE
jgi:hypothetical protein